MKSNITPEVAKLRADIAKLTKRTPTSTDPRYLRERLSYLEARKDAGDDVRRRNDPATAMSVSLPLSVRKAVGRILDREKISVSELARRSLQLWAEKNGYEAEAEAIAQTTSQ